MWGYVKERNAEGKLEEQVCGVLTDYDLSSWREALNLDYTKTSQHRTGTPPYMAQELLKGTSRLPLYRHDVESLFYIMLLMSTRHTIGTPVGEKASRVLMRGSKNLPHQDWFNESTYPALGHSKYGFFSDVQAIDISPVFEDFRNWLVRLRKSFRRGFLAKVMREDQMEVCDEDAPVGVVAPFDGETLGGWIKYPSFIEAARHLSGQLKDLVIRYIPNPTPPQPPTPAGATARAGACVGSS